MLIVVGRLVIVVGCRVLVVVGRHVVEVGRLVVIVGCMGVVSSMTHRQLTPASRSPRREPEIASNNHSLLTTTSTSRQLLSTAFKLIRGAQLCAS